MKTKTILGALAILVFPVAAWAQDARIVTCTPDQSAYLKKRTEELIRLSKAKDHNAKVDLYLKLAEERTKELEAMQNQGKSTHHDALGTAYSDHITKGAGGAIENGAARGQDMTGAVGRYADATSKHIAVLERVLANAPPAARKGLLNAIAASQHGHEQAMAAHQRGKGRSGAGGGHGQGKGKPGDDDGPGKGKGPDGPGKAPGGDDGPGKGNPHGPPPGKGKPGEEGGPGKGKGPDGNDEGPGKGPAGDERPGKGKDKGPGGPPPGKGDSNDDDNGPGKGKPENPGKGGKGKGK